MPHRRPFRSGGAAISPFGVGSTATAWPDALVRDGAESLVDYEDPHLGRWAAITTHAYGHGRVTYVGTLPDHDLAVALGRRLRPGPDPWTDRPPSVTVTSARNSEGERLRFVSNWSWHRVSVPLPVAARDLLSGTDLGPGENLELESWDVRVLLELPAEE